MKKYIYIIVGGIMLSISPVFSLSLQKQNIVDSVIKNIENSRWTIEKKEEQEQRDILYAMISQAQRKTHTIEIIDYLLEKIDKKQQDISIKEQETLPEHIGNLDITRENRIELHNIIREENGLEPYKYNIKLGQTAQERADYLAQNMITRWTHARTWTQWRNTKAITQRFNDRWIDFTIKNQSRFSESIGYGYSNCSPNELCNKLLDDTQSTRNFFMREKSYNWPHYGAIVHPEFTEIWIGIAVNKKRYYIVVHYGTEVITYEKPSEELTHKDAE